MPEHGYRAWIESVGRTLVPFWRPESGIFLALWLTFLCGGRDKLFRDPGTFWHTRLGQMMISSRTLVESDPFSFTAAEKPWIPHQWLGECLMAFMHSLAGWDSLLLATATLLAGLYTWLAHRLIRAGIHWSVAMSFVALVIAASSSHFHVRPHLSTIVFFGLTFALLIDYEAGRIRLSRLLWLVPLYAVWSNLHGGMLGGLATMGLAVCGWTFFRLLRLDAPLARWSVLVPLSLLVLACGMSAFLNPYGWRLPETWLAIMRMPGLTEIIQEHRPLNPTRPDGYMVLLLAAVYLVLLAGVRPLGKVRVTWLLPLVWLYLACTRIRHAPLFAIAAGLAVVEIFPHTRWAAFLVSRGSDLFFPPPPAEKTSTKCSACPSLLPFLLPTAIVVTALLLQMSSVNVPVVGRGWAAFDPSHWPIEMTDTLRKPEPGTRIFNEMNLGGYLIYFTPQLRVFIDDRCELYGEEFLKEYDEAEKKHDHIERWEKKYRFDLALTKPGSGFDAYFRNPENGWMLDRESQAAVLYRRAQ